MYICPNINLPEWKLLVKKAGSYDAAFDVFIRNKYEVPTEEQINVLYKSQPTIDASPEAVKNHLVSTGFFRNYNNQVLVKNKNSYPQAIAEVGKINKQVPGLVKLLKSPIGWSIQITEGQQELFDLPSSVTNKLLLPGFKSFYQQKEAVDVISSSVLGFIRDNPTIKTATFKQAIKNFEEKLTIVNATTPKDIYKTILNNLDPLSVQARRKLQLLNLIGKPKLEGTDLTKTIETTEKVEEEGVEEVEAIGAVGKDEWVFQYDSKDNALKAVKKFLAFVPKTIYKEDTNEFKLVQSVVPGQPSFMSYDEVYEQLKAVLAGTTNTWEAVESELLKHTKGKPFIHSVLKRINTFKEDKEQLKRQFVSSMSSSYSGFKTILIKDKRDREGNKVGQYFNVIDTDQSSVEKTILTKWQGEFTRSGFYKNVEGNLEINHEAVQTYKNNLEAAKINPTPEKIDTLLKEVGITLSPNTLNQLVTGVVNRSALTGQFTNKSGLFKLIELRLSGKTDEGDQEETEDEIAIDNPLTNNSAVRALAKLESYNTDYYYSNTFKDGEGNTVYSYTFNKFLTKEFTKLLTDENHVKNLLNITFNKPIYAGENPTYQTWLYQLANEPAFKSVFNISPLDTLKLSGNYQTGTKLTSMSELDLELTQLALIQNSGQRKKGLGTHKDGARIIKYLLTVPSKTTSYAIQGIGQDVKLFFDQDGYRIDKETRNALYSIAASEHNRILAQQARTSNNSAYNKGNKLFYFFPTLNAIVINEDKTIKLPTDKLTNGLTVEEAIRNEIDRIIKKDIQDKITQWQKLGIASDHLLLVDANYEATVLHEQTTDQSKKLTLAAADYVINSILAKFNTHQTFIDDPAVYFKKNVKDTWDNIGKRLTNLIAPFKDGMIDENNKNFLSVKLADRKAVALNNAQLQARLSKYYEENNIALPYDNIVGTDAAEYVTLKEELAVMYMYGEITTELYNSLLAKIKEQGDNLVLTKEELQKTVFLPRKPVYSSRIVSKEDDVVYREYIKSASIALLPQFTKGLEIDKLRVGMEKVEASKGLTVRAVFDSGTKIGGKGSIDIWNKDGSIKSDLDLTSNSVVLERSNFGIQQEVPYDETKDETVRSTQVLKGLFDSLNEVGGFRYNQKVYNGEELNKLYVDLQQKLYEKGLSSLEKRILNKDGQLAKAEVIDLLRNEGIKRNYSPAQLSFLEVNEDRTDFELPFWAHTNNDKEQAMLTSLWTNKVLKQKMPGGSYVLVSEEGMQGKSLGTLYTKDYNPNTGLKPMRIVYKKDTVQLEEEDYKKLTKVEQEGYREIVKPAQVLITWNIRDKVGKLLDRTKFINEEGFLDTTKIPKDLLTQFGFRIPNQGHNSMGLIEIVGFLPETYQGVVIATRNFITQMGSDFDVDKLYVYSYYLQVNDGVVSRTDDPQNTLVDIHKSVLYNPKVFNSVVKPLDLGRIKYETTNGKVQGIAQQIKEQQEKTTENYLNPDYSKDKYLQSVDGKAMVGLTSTSNVFSTLLQNKNVFLQKQITIGDKTEWIPDYIVFADSKGKELKLSNISSSYTVTGRKKNEVHQGIQSAAVDNEKDPVLSYINVSPATSSVLTQLIDLGLEEEEIYGFLAQPILVDYATKVKLSKSSVSETKREEEILAELEQTQKTILDSLKVKLKTDQLADFPLGIQDFNQVLFRQAVDELTNEEIQALVLAKFVKIKQYGDILQRAQNLLNIESKGVGKGLLDLADKRRAIDKALNIASFANLHKIVGELEEGHVIPETITGFGLVNSIYAADDTVTNAGLMPFSTNQFDEIVQQYEDIINRDSTAEQKYEIWKAVKAYTYSKFLGQDERQRVFFDKGTNKSLNTRITELLKTKLKHNEFILRLDLSKVDITGNNPSHVFYNASKEADIEEINTYQGLYELVFNEDAEVRGIGQDLIRYFYLNGGNQSAKDWGRFISRDMLDQVGLTEFIRTVDFNQADTYGYKVGLSDVLLQMFQHKSYLAPKLKETTGIVKTKGEIKVIQSTIPRELIRGLGLVPVFNSDGNLYTLAKQDAEGNYIYNLTPPLGKKFFSEFQQPNQYSEAVESDVKKTLKKFEEAQKAVDNLDKSEQKVMPMQPPLAVYQNPIVGTEFADLINTYVEDALPNINSNAYHKEIAKLFTQLKPLLGNVRIQEIESNKFYAGMWDQKIIYVNTYALNETGKLNKAEIERVILKELVHVMFSKVFNHEGFTPTTEQIKARTAITTLYESLRERILAGELTQWDKGDFIKFSELIDRNKAHVGNKSYHGFSESEIKFLADNKAKYYGLTNIEDFVHEALLEPGFRDLLNTVNHSTGKSLLDRISDLILEILDGFRELVGLKKDSALEEAFYNVIQLTKTKDEVKQQKKEEGIQYNAQQKTAIQDVFDFIDKGNPNEFYVVEGKAGTGKTTIAQEIGKRYKKESKVVAALSNKAKSVIKQKFIESKAGNTSYYSIAGLLGMKLDMETGNFERKMDDYTAIPIENAKIIIIDEASMINEQALELIMQRKQPKAKVIFLGDIGQLPPIRTTKNPYYASKTELFSLKSPVFKGKNKSQLTERVRQGEASPILPFADKFWENSQVSNPATNPASDRKTEITSKGSLVLVNSFNDVKDSVLVSFKKAIKEKNPNYIKVVTYKNDTRKAVNKYVHDSIFGADSKDFNEGELIIFNNSFGEDIENSTETQVLETSDINIDPYGIEYIMLVAKVEDVEQSFPVVTYRARIAYAKAISDQFNKAFSLKGSPQYKPELKKAWDLKNKYADVDYGYAITSHKSQGSTYDIVVVDERDIMSVGPITNKEKSESIYTALTRPRNVAIVISATPVAEAAKTDIENVNNLATISKTINKDINEDQVFYDLVEDSIKDKEEKNYKGIIDDFAVRLKRISDDIGKAYAAKDTELITALKNRLIEVQTERDNLIADNTVETLIAQAENDFTYVENLFKKPDISDNDLAYIKLVLGTWTKVGNPEIYDVLTSFDLRMQTPKKVRIQQIVDKARGLQDILNQVNIDILKTQAEEELGRKVSRKQLTTLSDISSAQASFRDITSSNNVILDVVDKWVRKSEFKATTELNELIEEAEKLTKALNTKGIKSREDFAEIFGQLNEKGELTGEIVDALSHHYHATRNALNDAMTHATSPENKKIASVIYYNWIRDNHILLDPTKLFKENVDGIFEENEDKAYLSIMEEQLGEDYTKTVANAKVLIAEYNEELKQQIAYYKDNVDGHKKLEVWRLENSPLIYLDNLVNGLTIRKVEGITIYNKGWKYVAKRVKPEWEDNKYNEIQKDADKKAYYEWYRSSLKDLYNYLPYNIRKELKYTEIPNIEKELVQEIHDAGMAKIANRTWSSLLDNISVSKNEPQGLIDPSTRGLEKEFRFAYIEKLNPKYKSYDLTQTLKLFAAQAIAYKFKSQVEDQIRLADSVLKEALEQQVKSNGEVVTDKFGRTTSVKGLENLRKQLDYAIDAYYGNKKDTREGKTNINFITPKDKERLQAEIAEINELDIPQVSKDIMIQKATDKYTKSLTWSKVGDTLLQYAQLKGMGWNIFGGVNNALFGQVANYNWSVAGVDFSDSDMNKAVGIMLKAQSPVDSDEKTKIESLMIKFNTVKQLRDKIYNSTTNYNKSRQGMKKLLPYELYAQGEYFVQGQVMVALLNAQKVKVIEDGIEKEIPLYEALDNEGNWNSAKFGENPAWSKLGKSTMDFKFKLDTLLKKIHGNYDPQSAILINKKFFGRALIQFRRWIPEGVAQRFDSEKYDNYLQRTTKGRYSTYYDLGWKNSAKVLLKSAITRGSDKAFEGLGYEGAELELVKENMKKNLREIYFKLSLMGMYIMLSGLDDEDETQRKIKNYSINTVLRLQDDIEFYYSPIAFDNITRSALPVTNIIVDFAKFSDAFLDTMNGEGIYKSGIHSGDSKLLWRGAKLLPFTSTVAGLINKGENAENFRK